MGIMGRGSSAEYVKNFILFVAITTVLIMNDSVVSAEESKESQIYIVHVEEPEMGLSSFEERNKWYSSFLPKTRPSDADREGGGDSNANLVHAYKNVITGFAARLTKSELEAMRQIKGFVDANPDRVLHLQTTYSAKFLGLDPHQGLWPRSNTGKGVIIGILDGGISPESPSFKPDDKIGPVPSRWKGICQTSPDFNASSCNNKLIGARIFTNIGPHTARDLDGHGTHTASTAAGSPVANAGIFGNAEGTAQGMAPGAHIAVYKVCRDSLCMTSDVLAGMDEAISDGVDVLSLSLGGGAVPYYDDDIAIGAFYAMERGIFVSCAAGNNGPAEPSFLENSAPWIMTVGASSMDRHFVANLKLGDGTILYGESLFNGMESKTPELSLVRGNLCVQGALDLNLIKGKLVVCMRGGPTTQTQQGEAVREAGGAGVIFINDNSGGEEIRVDVQVLPSTTLGYKAALALEAYMTSTKTPTAAIQFHGTVFGAANNISAPAVASFSSRGPNVISPEILKPDVIAPGFGVLAAWPSDLSPSRLPQDQRRVMFNIMYGTSMSTPHVSGVAALLKNTHPEWSPAAIKSALITTADHVDKKGGPILDGGNSFAPADIFATGAGHINPERAADPGLIYDLSAQEYGPYLCGLKYTVSQIRMILNKNNVCPTSDESTLTGNLNYPSFSLVFDNLNSITLRRSVTNVGAAKSTYSVNISPPRGVDVTVSPTSLSFEAVLEKKSYSVTFVVNKSNANRSSVSQGSITWVSSSLVYSVRSPISVAWNRTVM
ncbi:hypothetical protein SUGI_1021550 [Cryptomeria japonica]|uniref:subtilisin-like protease 4 n=1 Tax=Cryptomeria japonica TaxID=3369 RepID=UPI0024147E44|nr:subtilisin-like protease 4 [Cryptomeria japonica]GLJ48391.1 hypothetical protein SUGI_1021550 [Cryptomeria japonica]